MYLIYGVALALRRCDVTVPQTEGPFSLHGTIALIRLCYQEVSHTETLIPFCRIVNPFHTFQSTWQWSLITSTSSL